MCEQGPILLVVAGTNLQPTSDLECLARVMDKSLAVLGATAVAKTLLELDGRSPMLATSATALVAIKVSYLDIHQADDNRTLGESPSLITLTRGCCSIRDLSFLTTILLLVLLFCLSHSPYQCRSCFEQASPYCYAFPLPGWDIF